MIRCYVKSNNLTQGGLRVLKNAFSEKILQIICLDSLTHSESSLIEIEFNHIVNGKHSQNTAEQYYLVQNKEFNFEEAPMTMIISSLIIQKTQNIQYLSMQLILGYFFYFEFYFCYCR